MLKDGVRVMRPTSPTQTGPPRGAKAAKQGKKPKPPKPPKPPKAAKPPTASKASRALKAFRAAKTGGSRGIQKRRAVQRRPTAPKVGPPRRASAASPPYETGEAKQCDSRGNMQCNRSVCANTSTSTNTVTIPGIGKPAAPKLILRTPDPHFLSRVLGQVERLTFQRGWSSLETLRLARQNPQSSLMENVAAAVAAETKAKERSDALKKNQNALCKECGNDNRADFGPTVDGDAMVCNRCGVVSSGIFKSLHRDRNCTEDEDKTVRAERPREETTDRFSQNAPSTEEARRARERESRGTYHSRAAKEKQGLGWAPELVARKTAQAERNRKQMAPKDQTKELQILQKLDDLFATLEPMEPGVKRYCRIQAYCTWQNAVRHAACCKSGGACQLNVYGKGFPVIAESVLICALQNLADEVHTIEGVSRSQVVALNNKLAGRIKTSSASAAQRAVRHQIAKLMAHDDVETPPPPCAQHGAPKAEPEAEAEAPAPAPAQPATPARKKQRVEGCSSATDSGSVPTTDELFEQLRTGKLAGDGDAYDSDNQGDNGGDVGEASETAETAEAAGEGKAESNDDEPLTDHAKRLQENINRLHASVMTSTHAAVKAGAYVTFQINDCMNELAALSTTDDRLRWLSLQAFAFVLLEAVARRSEKQLVEQVGWRTKKAHLIQSESATRMRPRLLQSIGMTAERVEAAVCAVDEQLSESVDCIIAEQTGDAMPYDDGASDDDALF